MSSSAQCSVITSTQQTQTQCAFALDLRKGLGELTAHDEIHNCHSKNDVWSPCKGSKKNDGHTGSV